MQRCVWMGFAALAYLAACNAPPPSNVGQPTNPPTAEEAASTPAQAASSVVAIKGVTLGMPAKNAKDVLAASGYLIGKFADVYSSDRVDVESINALVVLKKDTSCEGYLSAQPADQTSPCQRLGLIKIDDKDSVDMFLFNASMFNAERMSFQSFAQSIVDNYSVQNLSDVSTTTQCSLYEGGGGGGELVKVTNCPSELVDGSYVLVSKTSEHGEANFN